MIALGIYLLKVILCSGALYLYYLLVLKNRQFHQYNRFYLLLVASISWLVPLIKIDLSQHPLPTAPAAFEFMQVIAEGNSDFEQMTETINASFDWSLWIVLLLLAISLLILSGVLFSFYKIYSLLSTHPCIRVQSVQLVITEEKGTPFSFFNFIFWHKSIDLKSEIGHQMLAHEMVHVNEKHSSDKLFMECFMIIGWFNPVFWLLKKELYLIHEFIADQKSIENKDASILASLLLTAAYPQQQNLLSNPFFFSPIKRRIFMLTNSSNPKSNYMRRLLVLPLLSLLVLLFAFRIMDQSEINNDSLLDKKYTVYRNEGIFILDKAPCPALLVETGYLTNPSDLQIIKKREEEIADKLLEGLKAYLSTAKTKQLPEQKPVSKIDNERTRLYEQLVKEFCKKEVKGADTIYKGTIPVERQPQIDSLYARMSKEERQQCFLILMMRTAPKIKPHVPTAADFERFKNAAVYGIWVDGKHVPNSELLKYKNTDFANYFASRLYGAAKKGRKYSIQVDLDTKGYYEKINKEKVESKFRWFEVRMNQPWVRVVS
jgi:beta-lactamase regulating signal transducer with metallopeptidase domain